MLEVIRGGSDAEEEFRADAEGELDRVPCKGLANSFSVGHIAAITYEINPCVERADLELVAGNHPEERAERASSA